MCVLLFVAAAADVYIYRSLKNRILRKIQLLTAPVFLALLVVVMLVPVRTASNDVLRVNMWLLYIFISVYVSKLIYILLSAVKYVPTWFGRQKWNAMTRVGGVCAVICFVAFWWGALINRFNIDVRHVTVQVPATELPEAFDGLTIAQISDLHTGTYGTDTSYLHKLVKEINGLHADMILFTGDIVNRNSTELKPFLGVLSQLHAPMGVYSVLGNHDYGDYSDWPSEVAKAQNVELLKRMQRSMNWKLLDNCTDTLVRGTDSLFLIGVENIGEPPFHVYGSLPQAYKGNLGDGHAKILMSHNPRHWADSIAENKDCNILLTLSGHTHAMQMEVMGVSPSALRYKEWGGLTRDSRGQNLYVNIGIGTVGFPARIGATPEVTLITLQRAKK